MSSYKRNAQLDRASVIKSMINSRAITQDGGDWLTLRLDPFHDFQRPIAGYPDADSMDTVVSAITYEYNVSKPAAAAGNWDAHVFTLPRTYVSSNTVATNGGNQQITLGTDVYSLGLVNVSKADAGQPLFPTTDPVVATNFSMESISTFAQVEEGVSRVIGMGLEIIDTTAALYKQGSLSAYRLPSWEGLPSMVGTLNNAGTMQTNSQVTAMAAPPSTVTEVTQYKSTVQWEAKEGVYMAIGQEGIENPFFNKRSQLKALTAHGYSDAGVATITSLYASTALQAPPLLTAAYGPQMKQVNCTQSGVILNGLHNDATFKVRVRVYVERAPLKTDTDLVPLSSPSAAYDYKALQLYSLVQSMLPIAVPVGFNAKGDWWRIIANVISKIAPVLGSVLTPIFGPEAGLIAGGVSTVANSVSRIGAKKRQVQKKALPAPK